MNIRRWMDVRRRWFIVPVALLCVLLAVGPASSATGWSARQTAIAGPDCLAISLAIDATGRPHVAAGCADVIRYAVRNGTTWSTTPLPTAGFDDDPQLVIDGITLYLGYSHLAPEGCGGDIANVSGVYVRRRTLPSGAWSAPTFVGARGDRLASLRVVNGVLHATVRALTGRTVYETNATGAWKRYAVPGGEGASSLRVGSDGRARIAYEAETSLRYAVFAAGRLQWSTIPGTTSRDGAPVLVLDASNAAHVVWQHTDRVEEGCALPDPVVTPADGTYYATNASGAWTPTTSRRFTRLLGPTSLTLDTASGRVHALVGAEGGVRYLTKPSGGSWTGVTISSVDAFGVALRLDQARQRVFAVFSDRKVYATTKP